MAAVLEAFTERAFTAAVFMVRNFTEALSTMAEALTITAGTPIIMVVPTTTAEAPIITAATTATTTAVTDHITMAVITAPVSRPVLPRRRRYGWRGGDCGCGDLLQPIQPWRL